MILKVIQWGSPIIKVLTNNLISVEAVQGRELIQIATSFGIIFITSMVYVFVLKVKRYGYQRFSIQQNRNIRSLINVLILVFICLLEHEAIGSIISWLIEKSPRLIVPIEYITTLIPITLSIYILFRLCIAAIPLTSPLPDKIYGYMGDKGGLKLELVATMLGNPILGSVVFVLHTLLWGSVLVVLEGKSFPFFEIVRFSIGLVYLVIILFFLSIRSILTQRYVNKLKLQVYNLDSNGLSRGVYGAENIQGDNLYTFGLYISERFKEDEITEYKLNILNKCYYSTGYNEMTENEEGEKKEVIEYIVVSKNEILKNKQSKYTVSISYKKDNKYYSEKIYVLITLGIYNEILYPEKIEVIDWARRYWEELFEIVEKKFNLNIRYKGQNNSTEYEEVYRKLLPNLLVLDVSDDENEINEWDKLGANETKWLHHNGFYGTGKTTYGVMNITQKGYTPIVISPYADDTAHDFMYYIFLKFKEISGIRWMKKISYKAIVLYVVTLFPLISLTVGIIENYIGKESKLVENILGINNVTQIFIVEILGIIIISVILGVVWWFIYSALVDKIIVYKKGFGTYYKEALVDEILYVMNRTYDKKYIFVIEDIDRLPIDEVKIVMRDLVYINNKLNKSYTRNYPIGIVSYDRESMERAFRRKETYSEEYNAVHEKIFCEQIFEEYRLEESIKKYMKNIDDIAYKNTKLLNESIFIVDPPNSTEAVKLKTFRIAKKAVIKKLNIKGKDIANKKELIDTTDERL